MTTVPPSFPDASPTRGLSRDHSPQFPPLGEGQAARPSGSYPKALEGKVALTVYRNRTAGLLSDAHVSLNQGVGSRASEGAAAHAEKRGGSPPLPWLPQPSRCMRAPPFPGLQSQPYRLLALLIKVLGPMQASCPWKGDRGCRGGMAKPKVMIPISPPPGRYCTHRWVERGR